MSKPILFISDLHLQDDRPDLTRALLMFLQENKGKCEALYILGDLFEVWLGDDGITATSDTVAQALHEFAGCGSDVYLMHGNRDFRMGTEFAARCGASLWQPMARRRAAARSMARSSSAARRVYLVARRATHSRNPLAFKQPRSVFSLLVIQEGYYQ